MNRLAVKIVGSVAFLLLGWGLWPQYEQGAVAGTAVALLLIWVGERLVWPPENEPD